MKVTLLSPPFKKDYMRNARCDFVSLSHSQWYPLWLGYCGAVLEQHGHEVQFIDAPARGIMHEETLALVQQFKPQLLVVYGGEKSQQNDIEIGVRIKKAINCPVAFVGPYVSADPEEIMRLSDDIDYAVKGEFEYPIVELLEGKTLSAIQNLLFREPGLGQGKTVSKTIIKNPVRPLLSGAQLDKMPFVTAFFKKHVTIRNYKTPSEYYPFLDTITGRGCQWGICTFCLWVHTFIPGKVYNLRSVDNVMNELRFIKKELPEVRSIMFQDDTMTTERADELCDAMLKENLKLTWSCYARANMKYPILKKMKDAGCRNLHVGFESANATVLKNVKKGTTLNQMREFARDAHLAGIQIHADFAIGYVGETKESIQETIAFAKEIDPHTAQFQLFRPLKGTPMGEELRNSGQLTADGYPNYENMSEEELREWAKKAYRDFYFRWGYVKKAMGNPQEYVFNRFDQMARAVPHFIWRRWH